MSIFASHITVLGLVLRSAYWVLVVGAVLTLCGGCDTTGNELVKPEPPLVTVAKPLKQSLRTFVEQNGVTEAAQTAEVRARVSGYIESVIFEPGQAVKGIEADKDVPKFEGDVLYQIEPDAYQAAYDSAVSAQAAAAASVTVAEAQVALAKAELEKASSERTRQVELKQRGAVSEAEFEAAIAAFKSAEANVSAAAAAVALAKAEAQQASSAVAQAKLDLDYATVRAPIDGQVSKTLVKLGNLVEPGTLLAEVTDSSEVFVNFSVSDREALRYFDRQLAAGVSAEENRNRWAEQKVYLAREVDDGFPFVGVLDYVDQTGVDAATGTLGLRAKFGNPERRLLPGLFVRLRLPSKESYEAILIPDSCVLRDSKRTYVFTVGAGNQVDETVIKVGEGIDGWLTVTDGLDETVVVIVEGIQKTRKGAVVNPTEVVLQRRDLWSDETEKSE